MPLKHHLIRFEREMDEEREKERWIEREMDRETDGWREKERCIEREMDREREREKEWTRENKWEGED